MNILGISAFYHDSAACLITDGRVIAAAQEERFTRKKHDHSFPDNAIHFCLDRAGLKGSELDYVAFYDKPFLKFERILETYLQYAPFGIRSFLQAMPLWIRKKLWIKELIREGLNYSGTIIFPEHHDSHAASAFYPSPFNEAAFLTLDGVGEWSTTSFGIGRGNKISTIADIRFPHSLGLLYSAFTYYTGFKVNSGEYKLMGLAPYGEPIYKQKIYGNLLDVRDDGSFRMNMEFFDFCVGLKMTNRKFNKLFGGPPRKPESALSQKEMDIARSIQEVCEEVIVKIATHVKKETSMRALCLAGGVALNCVANGKLLRSNLFEDIWIQPASGDAGGALGCALFTWFDYLAQKRTVMNSRDFMQGSYLGPEFSNTTIKSYLQKNEYRYQVLTDDELPEKTADLVVKEKVIGWFQGRMEFGPRALGARSIIGDARSSNMQKKMNLKIKYRESFRPFAPSVRAENISEYFEMGGSSPYMLLVAEVNQARRIPETDEERELFGIEKLNVPRSDIPAITHVDYSARVQSVHEDTNPQYHQLLSTLHDKYGCAVIVNTSFNVRGEPIVCTPEDAIRCFMRTEMDYLVIGNYLLDKKEQPPVTDDSNWQEEFELD